MRSRRASPMAAPAVAALILALSALGADPNLLRNPGFEMVNEKTGFAEYWGMNAAYPGDVSLVEDAAASHRGSRCVSLRQTGKVFVAMNAGARFPVGPQREVVVRLWARGEGTLSVVLYNYSTHAYIGATPVGEVAGPGIGWKACRWPVTIPETSHLHGQPPAPVAEVCLAFHVTGGPLFVDDTAVYWRDQEPAVETAPAEAGTVPVAHLITIPKTTRAPDIDGTMAVGEWDRAAGVTGFQELGGSLAGRQTLALVTYTDTEIFVAMQSVKEGRVAAGGTGRDGPFGQPHDALEVWLMPPDSGWFQFYGVPGGGFLDLNQAQMLAWNGRWRYASRVTDTGDVAGGIQTFARQLWTAEIAIPFADLGVSAPQPDQSWRLNFCRDWAEDEGRMKTSADWTTWSHINGSFATPEMFATARFGGDSPAVQVTRLGDLVNGNLGVSGRVCGAAGDAVTLAVDLLLRDGTGKVVFSRQQPLTLPGAGVMDFAVTDTVKVRGTTDMKLVVRSERPGADGRLTRLEVPFTMTSSFVLKPVPIHAKGFMDVVVDASRVADLPDVAELLVELPGTGLQQRLELRRAQPSATVRFDMATLKPGEYLVRGDLRGPGGTVIAASAEPLPVPARPAWLDNRIGMTDEVPPPWTPVAVAADGVKVVEREYAFGNNGLPRQVVALGEELLAGPVELDAVVDGRQVPWDFRPLKEISRTPRRVTWEVQGKGGPLTLSGVLWLEFDGVCRYTFEVAAVAGTALDALRLVVPVKKPRALYARARRQLPPGKFVAASLYPNPFASACEVDVGNYGTWVYSPTWKWPQTVFNEVFVGDDRRGLALFTESDQYLKGPRYADFATSDTAVTLTVSLIGERTELTAPLRYDYGYLALPVKPRPDDPRLYQPSYFATDKYPEFIRRSGVAVNYHILANLNYPAFRDPAQGRALVERLRTTYGVGVVADTYMSAASVTTPEYQRFGYEWEVLPRDGWVISTGRAQYACQSTSHAQFYLDCVRRMVEDMGLGGVYIDVSGPMANLNPYSGCGYVDAAGERRPTVPIWASRQLFQRLYTYLHTGGRAGIIYSHTTNEACLGGYVDVVTEGEHWGTEQARQYRRLSPDMFRAAVMTPQFGTPCTFYTFHQYSWRGDAYGTPVSLNEVLMMSLLHGTMVSIGDDVGMRDIPPVWDLVCPYLARGEFSGYWDSACPVATGSEQVLASAYRMPGEPGALVVVGNWAYAPAEAAVTVDWARLGLDPARPTVAEALTGTALTPEAGRLRIALAARDLTLLRLR